MGVPGWDFIDTKGAAASGGGLGAAADNGGAVCVDGDAEGVNELLAVNDLGPQVCPLSFSQSTDHSEPPN